jgi:O-methyltransferase
VNKRGLVAFALRKPVDFLDWINYSARFGRHLRSDLSGVPVLQDRLEAHEFVKRLVGDVPLDYLEFGVWRGTTFKKWLEMNRHPDSRFSGFDSFEGLPEDWFPGQPKGTFSTGGVAPDIDDARGSFEVGWFQNTLYPFLSTFKSDKQLVVHIDCDLYSSTLFVLGALDRHLTPGTVIIFDDFSSLTHEFAAWLDYRRSFSRSWSALARTDNGAQAVFRLDG